MAEWRSYCKLFLGLCLVFQATGNKTRKHPPVFLQNMCFDGHGSNYTLPLNTGRQVSYWATSDYFDFLDCRITLTSGKEWIGLVWRELTLLPDEQTMPDCDRAFVELSTPSSRLYRFCGRLQDMPSFHQRLEFSNTDITLRLFVNFTTPSTQLPITSTSGALPDVRIVLDFTAFTYCSSPGTQNFVCRQSERCLDKSLRCDELLNCVSPAYSDDKSDQTQCLDPSVFGMKNATTGDDFYCTDVIIASLPREASDLASSPRSAPCHDGPPDRMRPYLLEPPPPNLLLDLMPLWVTLGALGGLLVLNWCFYKPGYLPWRLARIRNARCCGHRSSSVGNQRGCFNCCSKSHGRSVSPITKTDNPESSVQSSTAYNDNSQVISDDNNFNYQPAAVNWMSIKYDDGNHQRELR